MLRVFCFTISILPWQSIAIETTLHHKTAEELSHGSIRGFYPYGKWHNGILTYELHTSLTAQHRNIAQMAINDIQSKTCVRFQARVNERSYVSIQRNDSFCGWAHYCKTGQPQLVMIGQHCTSLYTMVHELSHSLCLGDEQDRADRDNFLEFKNCPANEIPRKDTQMDTRGHLYDYNSVMHNSCGKCSGGWPTMKGVGEHHCARRRTEGLSVLDADKLNDFYGCQGCFTHRWRSIDSLTDEDKNNMVSFGSGKTPGDPYYLCRGYVGGAIHAGKYWKRSGICYLPYGGREHFGTKLAQVFTLPGGNTLTNSGAQYETVWMNSDTIRNAENSGILSRAVKVGRKVGGEECYAAIALIHENNNGKEIAIGTVCKDNLRWANFPEAGWEYYRSEYALIVCNK